MNFNLKNVSEEKVRKLHNLFQQKFGTRGSVQSLGTDEQRLDYILEKMEQKHTTPGNADYDPKEDFIRDLVAMIRKDSRI